MSCRYLAAPRRGALYIEALNARPVVVRRPGDGLGAAVRRGRAGPYKQCRSEAAQRRRVPGACGEHVAKLGRRLVAGAERQIGLAKAQLGFDPFRIGLQGAAVQWNGRIEIARFARFIGLANRCFIVVAPGNGPPGIEAARRREKRQACAKDRRQLHSALCTPAAVIEPISISDGSGATNKNILGSGAGDGARPMP